METVTDFIFLGPIITTDGDCSHEIKTFAPWKKSYDKPRQCIKKAEITLPTKASRVKAMIFPVVTHGCESCTIKKVECQSIDAFNMWCWRRLLRVPWKAKRSNQSILMETNPVYSLEGLKLKLQYFGHLMCGRLTGKDLDAGEDWGQEDKGATEDEMVRWHHQFNAQEFWQTLGDSEGQGSLVYCSSWGHKESDCVFVQPFVSEWTTTNRP